MRKKLSLFSVVFLCTVFLAVQCFADFSYTIKKGDNPQTLAKKFKVSAQDIIKCNHLSPKKLKPGMKISIPSKETASSEKHRQAMNPNKDKRRSLKDGNQGKPTSPDEETHHSDSVYHIVDKGDTLLVIAKQYSVSVSDLKEMNDLSSSKLKIGQRLLLKRTDPKSYTVKKGDSLYQIARHFDVDVNTLREINELNSDSSLKPGQKIILAHEPDPEIPKQYETILSQGVQSDEGMHSEPQLEDKGLHDKLILFAKKLLNIPYRFGGNSIFGIDCSAYVQKVYNLIGVNLPRSAREQFTEGDPIDKSELSIGDLVFFRTYASFPSHVGIYLGNNLFIHASSRSKKVTIDSLDTPYYTKRFIGAKRVIEMKDGKDIPGTDG